MVLPFTINDWLLWLVVGALSVFVFELKSTKRAVEKLERAVSALAARRKLALCTVFVAAIGARLLMLPILPVPNPGVHDEFSYLLMADTFLHGRLANPPHPMWMSFETFHVLWFPAYASKYPPAQGFTLAVGQLLGHPWIGVLLSLGAMCAAVVWMLQGWMPARWALLGGFLMLVKFALLCYWSNGYFGGCVAATAGAMVVGALPRIWKRPRARDAVIMGIGVAILANSRPYEGFLLSAAVFIALAWRTKEWDAQRRHMALKQVALPLAVVLACTAGFIAYYNWRVTGDPLLLPHALYQRTYDTSPIFLWQKGEPLHSYNNVQLETFFNNGWARRGYNGSWKSIKTALALKGEWYADVFFWPGALLLVLCLPFVFRDRRARPLLWLLLPCLAGISIVVWSLPHYAAPIVCLMFAVLVQCMRHLRQFRLGNWRPGPALARTMIVLLLVNTISQVESFMVDPEQMGWLGKSGIDERAEIVDRLKNRDGKYLIFVRYAPDHNINFEWVYNSADIDNAKIVWAREISPEQDAKLRAYFKDRQFWVVEPDIDGTKLLPYTPIATASAER